MVNVEAHVSKKRNHFILVFEFSHLFTLLTFTVESLQSSMWYVLNTKVSFLQIWPFWQLPHKMSLILWYFSSLLLLNVKFSSFLLIFRLAKPKQKACGRVWISLKAGALILCVVCVQISIVTTILLLYNPALFLLCSASLKGSRQHLSSLYCSWWTVMWSAVGNLFISLYFQITWMFVVPLALCQHLKELILIWRMPASICLI